jgi:hypothetical protein
LGPACGCTMLRSLANVVGALLRCPLPLDLLSCRCLWSPPSFPWKFPGPKSSYKVISAAYLSSSHCSSLPSPDFIPGIHMKPVRKVDNEQRVFIPRSLEWKALAPPAPTPCEVLLNCELHDGETVCGHAFQGCDVCSPCCKPFIARDADCTQCTTTECKSYPDCCVSFDCTGIWYLHDI